MTTRLAAILLASAALALAGCRSAYESTVPEPLPEDLAWPQPLADSAGAFLGVVTRENDSGSLENLYFEPGVRVTHVVANSPAQRAGIAEGDVLLTFAGTRVDDPDTLAALERQATAGTAVDLEIQRGDLVRAVSVALAVRGGEAPPAAPTVLYRLDRARSLAGWASAADGVRLVSARDASPFPAAGIPVGSVVHALDERDVRSDRDLVRRLAAADPGTAVQVDFTAPGAARDRVRVRLAEPARRITRCSLPVLFSYTAEADGGRTDFVLLDLWIVSLVRYAREGSERSWRFLRFLEFGSGEGELGE